MSVKYLATNWTLTSYTKHPRLKDHQWMGGQKDCGTQRRKYTRENHCLLNIKWQNRSWTHSSCDCLQDINNTIAWSLKGLTSLHGYLRSYWQIMASGGSVISFGFFFLGCGPWWVNHNTPQCMVPHLWHKFDSVGYWGAYEGRRQGEVGFSSWEEDEEWMWSKCIVGSSQRINKILILKKISLISCKGTRKKKQLCMLVCSYSLRAK